MDIKNTTPYYSENASTVSESSFDNDAREIELPKAKVIFKQAWQNFKQNWKLYVGIMAVPAILTLVTGIVGVVFGENVETTSQDETERLGKDLIIVSSVALISIIGVVLQLWAQAAMLFVVENKNQNFTVSQAYKQSLRLIIPLWWMSILSGFIVFGGFVLLIVPGILFGLWFSLSAFVFIAEKKRGLAALLSSKHYVKGDTGAVFGKLLYFGLMMLLGVIVIGLVAGIASAPFGVSEEVPNLIVNVVITLLATPLFTLFGYRVYQILKQKKGLAPEPQSGDRTRAVLVGVIGGILIPLVLIGFMVFVAIQDGEFEQEDFEPFRFDNTLTI